MGKTKAADLNMPFSRLVGSAAAHTPLGATANNGRFVAHQDIEVTGVKVTAEAAVTGANTNSATLKLLNLGADGQGTAEVASLPLTLGTDLAADTPKTIPLSATPANLLISAGQVLTFQQTKVGNGMDLPAMHLEVSYKLQ
jgi:hypothetical protein